MDENQIPESNQSQPSREISLKEQFTTVTTLSKYLALALFMTLPFIGFWLGYSYQNNDSTDGNLEERYEQAQLGADNTSSYAIQNCEDITFPESKDNCYFDYAQSRNDANLCKQIVEPERKTQCIGYLSQTDEEFLEMYTLSSLPDALGIDDSGEVFFSMRYAGVFEKADIKIYEVTKTGEIIKELGTLNDDGGNGDLTSGDYLYGGTFFIGPFSDEQEVFYQATLEFPSDNSKKASSEIYTFHVTRFPTEPIPDFKPIAGQNMMLNEVLVGFKEGVMPTRIEEIVNEIDGIVVDVTYGLNMYRIGLTTNDAEGVLKAVKVIEQYPEVEYAEPNMITSMD